MESLNLSGIGMTSQRTRDRLVARLREQGIGDERVLDAMRVTPRHIFLDEALAHRAYEDSALPIGFQQTLSRAYTVARMTELLLQGGELDAVLEIGTGSGYQSAVLAQLVQRVFSVERIRPLQARARERLRLLGLRNVNLRLADGRVGWPERAPYHGIIATAAAREIPAELLEQLAVGGRLVAPEGDGDTQQLVVVERTAEGLVRRVVESARFVPLVSGVIR